MNLYSILIIIQKIWKSIISFLYKSGKYILNGPTIVKLFTILCILLFLSQFYNRNYFVSDFGIEGFQQSEKFLLKEGNQVYDPFYVDIYDDLVYDKQKNIFEIDEIMRVTDMNSKNAVVLDVGCGTGHHLKMLDNRNIQCIGIDKSSAMIKKCKSNYPELNVKKSDALETIQFQPNSFSHILCLYFTIYSIKDKQTFFNNCYQWIKPGGYLAIHLVNRDMFDPIINVANPLYMVSPQKYSKERIMNSIVKFDNFQYKANFKYNKTENMAHFEETFKDDKSGNVRKNNHILYMEKQKDILNMAKQSGFILHGKIDMVTIQYEYQYIYILQKPN